MKCFLIDPARMIDNPCDPETLLREVDVKTTLEGVYQILGDAKRRVQAIEGIRHRSFPDIVYVDSHPDDNDCGCFALYKYPRVVSGRGLIVGIDENGAACPPTLPRDEFLRDLMIGHGNRQWTLIDGFSEHPRPAPHVWTETITWIKTDMEQGRRRS